MKDLENPNHSSRALGYILVGLTFLVVGILLGYFLAEPVISERLKQDIDDAIRENMAAIEETVQQALASDDFQLTEGELAAAVRSALDEQREAERLAALAPLYEGWEDDPYFGPENASVVMIEFSDFRCSYCGVFASETLPQIREEYADRVRFVYRDFPIFGELSLWASLAGQCALEQGDFWTFHDALFLRSSEYNEADFLFTLAEELGYDTEDFQICVWSTRYIEEVQADYAAAQSLGLNGTPAFYINGQFISGAQSFATFSQILDEALAEAETAAIEG